MELPDIRTAHNLSGTRVLVRLDLNVPRQGEKIVDDFRITKSLSTLDFLKSQGARVIAVSHADKGASLKPVAEYLKDRVVYFGDLHEAGTKEALAALKSGQMALLENLRLHPGEEDNDASFAKELAACADIFVNEAFSHRAHASVVSIPQYLPSYAGILFQQEVQELMHARNPDHPAVFILGGAKFETKEPLLHALLGRYDHIFVCGALANDFFKARGLEVGRSLIGGGSVGSELGNHKKIILPGDVVVVNNNEPIVKQANEVLPDEMIVDAGPESITALEHLLGAAKFILWNGTLGLYERGFDAQTKALARAIAFSGAYSVVGGGDTIASIAALDLQEKFDFVSTGGGAMLVFLESGTLPGIEALTKKYA